MRKDSLKVVLGILVTLQTAALSPVASPADQSPAPPTTRPAKAQHPRIQPRDAKADPHLIDLTNYYTLALTEDPSGAFGYTLDALPRGVQQIGNVQYDLRGIVQVSGQQFGGAKKIPEAVKGIPVGLKCRRIAFLHASRWTEDNGTKIGSYVIHYVNGQTQEVPIVFGVDLRDWRPKHDPDAGANGPAAAWHGHDNAGNDVVLFETTWTNPQPAFEVATIDVVSAMTNAAPFLVAVTAQ